MIIFYKHNNLSLFFFTIFITSGLLFSCKTLFFADITEPDLIELHIKDIFEEDTINLAEIQGYNYNDLIFYSVLQEIFEESSIHFFMNYSDDNTIQDLMKEIAIVESAEKIASFLIKRSEEITLYNDNDIDIEATEKLFIISFPIKQLLINCVKNIDPLEEEIELVIEEKKWDLENEEAEDTDLFFDIIKLENGISYLNKIKKSFLKNIGEINKVIDITESFLKQYSE